LKITLKYFYVNKKLKQVNKKDRKPYY